MTKEIIFLLSPVHTFRLLCESVPLPDDFPGICRSEIPSSSNFCPLEIKRLSAAQVRLFRVSSNQELWFMNRTEAMFAEQLHEFRQPALFVRAEVIVNVPAKIILAEIVVVFSPAADDVVEGVEAETLCFAQLAAQPAVVHATAQGPDGVNERQLRQVIPRRAQVPDFVLTR